MPSFSNNLFDTEIAPGQINQASPSSPIQVFNRQRYTLSILPAYSTDSQTTPYLPTSILINLEPQSSPPFISLPLLPGGILTVITDPQQCQPSDGIPILPISNHSKLHPCSYICTTNDHIPRPEIGSHSAVLKQIFANQPMT